MDLVGKRILLTGDSHMDWSPFGVKLEQFLREAGAQVTRKAIGGSAARQWASGRAVCRTINGVKLCFTAEDLRASGPYDLVVVSLGTNDAANASAANADRTRAAEQAASDVEKFMGLLGSPSFVVVGPPMMRDSVAHYTNANMAPLVDVFSRRFGSRYIDSRPVPKTDGDGVHMGRIGGAAWAQLVTERLKGSSSALVSNNTGGADTTSNTASVDIMPYVVLAVVGGISVYLWVRRMKRLERLLTK